MKKKKTIVLMIAAVCVIVSATVGLALLAGNRSSTDKPVDADDTAEISISTDTVEPIKVEEPESGEAGETAGNGPELDNDMEIPEGADIIELDENVTIPADTDSGPREKAKENTKPQQAASVTTPPETEAPKPQVTELAETAKYSCGTSGHRCDSPETHAFVQNLELEGCPYCGSHSCPSFYGVDQWGNGGFFPEFCPKYKAANDAAKYCQNCGRPLGDGSNGTCAQFVNACNCPGCGEWVEAWTCHNHG